VNLLGVVVAAVVVGFHAVVVGQVVVAFHDSYLLLVLPDD